MVDYQNNLNQNESVSQFNAAIDNLAKLSLWQYAAEICYSRGDYYNMKLNLDNVWMRVDIYIEEMPVEWQACFYELQKKLDYKMNVYKYMSYEVEQKKQTNDRSTLNRVNSQLGENCIEYFRMLRKVIHKKKMDMPEKRTFNPEDALDEGADE